MKVTLEGVLLEEKEVVSESGLVLTNTSKANQVLQYKVLSVGSEVKDVKEGDTVMVESLSGTDITIGEYKYKVVQEKQVLIIL